MYSTFGPSRQRSLQSKDWLSIIVIAIGTTLKVLPYVFINFHYACLPVCKSVTLCMWQIIFTQLLFKLGLWVSFVHIPIILLEHIIVYNITSMAAWLLFSFLSDFIHTITFISALSRYNPAKPDSISDNQLCGHRTPSQQLWNYFGHQVWRSTTDDQQPQRPIGDCH